MEDTFAESKRVLTDVFKMQSVSALVSSENKGWATQVPAAAVIPGPPVVTAIFGFKAFVAGLLSP